MPRLEEVVIDLAPIHSKRQLHEALQQALDFPHWYGKNWDAFWDAITGLVEMPRTLKLVGWQAFEDRLPLEAQHLRSAFALMTAKYPDWASTVTYT